MGLLNKIFGSEKKKDQDIKFAMPINGEIIKIEDIPDPVFAQKMMGDGFGIIPTDGQVYAPADGSVVSIFPTKHAIGMKMESGIEYLIHFGLDTVNLKGEGFTSHVKDGQEIKAGDLILEVDLDQVKDKVPSVITPVIFTNIQEPEFEGFTFEVSYGMYDAKSTDIINFKWEK